MLIFLIVEILFLSLKVPGTVNVAVGLCCPQCDKSRRDVRIFVVLSSLSFY